MTTEVGLESGTGLEEETVVTFLVVVNPGDVVIVFVVTTCVPALLVLITGVTGEIVGLGTVTGLGAGTAHFGLVYVAVLPCVKALLLIGVIVEARDGAETGLE